MSNPKPDGGSAFPEIFTSGPRSGESHADTYSAGGMSLRDYFAGQALAGLLACPRATNFGDIATDRDGNAKCAYAQADEMLAERAKGAES